MMVRFLTGKAIGLAGLQLCVCLLLCGGALRSAQADEAADREAFFEKQIRPLLVDRCQGCHGDDQADANLRLDSKSGWQRGGERGPAIVPGDPAASLLIRVVTHRDADLKMPPEDAGEKLSDQQIADLITWIRQGAVDPRSGSRVVTDIEAAARDHWAFQPVSPPAIEGEANPIDQLIDRKLRERGFEATEPADLPTLIRRATFDLHGLPPTAEQLATPREAFPQLVRDLLASPRYGERWGRHWLDVARYSDAKDGVLMYGDARIRPFAYTYRDYVIRAFNDDKPFDQFVREQLAADQLQLPADSPDLAALGLLTLGRMFDRNRHDVIDDQIDVISRGFLGLTVSCARCHDHKFDPVPTADYYSLYGVLASTIEPYDRPRIGEVTAAGQAFEDEFAAKLKQVYDQQQTHYVEVQQIARDRTADYLVQVATTEPDVAETAIFFLSLIPDQLRPQITKRWRQLIARRAFPDDPIFGPWHDLMREPTLQTESWRKRGVDERVIAGLVAANPQSPAEVAQAYGKIILDAWKQASGQPVDVGQPVASGQPDAAGQPVASGQPDAAGQPVASGQPDASGQPVATGATDSESQAWLADDPLASLLVSRDGPLWFPKEEVANYLSRTPGDAYRGLLGELDAIAVKHADAAARAMVVWDTEVPHDPVIFQRGDPSARGAPVARQFLEILSPAERQPFADGGGRLNLANAIASPDNPLTARVWVNRVWMHHFGQPLVDSPGDFGLQTKRPEHHELLDYLADYFVRNGWRTKPLHELILASQAYQRVSRIPASEAMTSQLSSDADNLLFWHANRRRLDFESMRDTLLVVAGDLDETPFGRPRIITDPANHRRTVYAFVERQSIPAMVQTFDFANADTSTPRRVTTTVPQQALFAMNSAFMLDRSKSLAAKVAATAAAAAVDAVDAVDGAASAEGAGSADEVEVLYRRVLGRAPSDDERSLCLEFRQSGSLEQLAQTLLMSNELMFVD